MRTKYRLYRLCSMSKARAIVLACRDALMLACFLLGLAAMLALAAGGCTSRANPSAPSADLEPSTSGYVPLHHNVPASMADSPEGPIWWLCATQPRMYVNPDGTRLAVEDHYLQSTQCPTVPNQLARIVPLQRPADRPGRSLACCVPTHSVGSCAPSP